ncbi:hypothetical protein O1611_g5059 [Lasiodiplodia mahajangana]|uniref:Uncharacterized protein n=1 Tax=Lasiodiplodia mahajangana TaxID=1108764 RepID=A0ACC2JMZ4_9PEZI|nr:hypothetical protein O1611_g5059 [Lasiodiplodia mahajangana]
MDAGCVGVCREQYIKHRLIPHPGRRETQTTTQQTQQTPEDSTNPHLPPQQTESPEMYVNKVAIYAIALLLGFAAASPILTDRVEEQDDRPWAQGNVEEEARAL